MIGLIVGLIVLLAYPVAWIAAFLRMIKPSHPETDAPTVRGRDAVVLQAVGMGFFMLTLVFGAVGSSVANEDLGAAAFSYVIAHMVICYWSLYCAWQAAGRGEARHWPMLALGLGGAAWIFVGSVTLALFVATQL